LPPLVARWLAPHRAAVDELLAALLEEDARQWAALVSASWAAARREESAWVPQLLARASVMPVASLPGRWAPLERAWPQAQESPGPVLWEQRSEQQVSQRAQQEHVGPELEQ
jgi:hypothetical protein